VRNPSALVRVALVMALCVVAGVCLAGLAFPVIGGLGLASKSVADEFKPERPPALVLPQATKILDRDGQVLATLFTENRVAVKLSQVPKVAQDALIAIEDSRFYEHRGIDVKGTLRALLHNSSSGSTQGGSTLTQQYVKNLLIETADNAAQQKAAVKRSVARKLQEARYAVYLEQHMTKQQILEGYFNIAYYGSGVYGIGTAARHYFNRRVELLTTGQAAMLAGMVQNPSKYDPSVPSNRKNALERRDVVLDRMVQLGYLTDSQKRQAISAPTGIDVQQSKSGCEAAVQAPFFCDYVRRYLEEGPEGKFLGATKQERQERLLSGGLTIRTTLDPRIQRAADKAVRDKVPPTDPSHLVAIADTVEPGTGEVKAMAVNRGFGTGKYETKVNFALGGTYGFQGGSTFKAFVLARALQMGLPPSLSLHAPTKYCSAKFTNSGKPYCPSNAGDSESGTFDMVKATWASVNTYFIQLEERTGIDGPLSLAESLGIRDMDGSFAGDSIDHNASFVFGAAGPHGYSPLAMASAYATFASSGTYCAPRPIASVTDSSGKELYKGPSCSQALEPAIADKVTAILRGVVDGPLKARTGGGAAIGRPVAGKTGTTNDERAAWFIGYTPQLATAVWMGGKSPTPMKSITIDGRYYPAVYGGSISAPIFSELMRAALEGVPVEPMPAMLGASGGAPANLVAVPSVVGLRTADAQVQLEAAGFQVTVGPAINATYPAGIVAAQSPSGKAPAGATITLSPSNGTPPAPTPTAGPSPTPAPTGKPKPTHGPKPTKGPAPTATSSP
jgi:membrane peptidoglycan carboxypeptidase